MPAIQRLTDANNVGGVINDTITPGNGDVYANGLLVSIDGSKGTSHPNFDPPHLNPIWSTANGSSTVFVHGIPVNRTGDADTCGHTRVGGSADVFAGG